MKFKIVDSGTLHARKFSPLYESINVGMLINKYHVGLLTNELLDSYRLLGQGILALESRLAVTGVFMHYDHAYNK